MNQTILRNLFYTLKRFRTASVLNLFGLSFAFAAFILIMMKVSYERNFDNCYPEPERLVMLNLCSTWAIPPTTPYATCRADLSTT